MLCRMSGQQSVKKDNFKALLTTNKVRDVGNGRETVENRDFYKYYFTINNN